MTNGQVKQCHRVVDRLSYSPFVTFSILFGSFEGLTGIQIASHHRFTWANSKTLPLASRSASRAGNAQLESSRVERMFTEGDVL